MILSMDVRKVRKVWSALLIILMMQMANGQEKQTQLVCSTLESGENIKAKGDIKIMPFSFTGGSSVLNSILPFLKNLPVVNSASEIPAVPIETKTKNVSVTCDVVSAGIKEQMKKLEDKVASLTKILQKIEADSVCPAGFSYLERCFRLMDVGGKKFAANKAEDLCNFNGGQLVKIDSSLLLLRVTEYLKGKLLSERYKKDQRIIVWLGMRYEMATITFPTATSPTIVPFPTWLPTPTPKPLNVKNRFLQWFPSYPRIFGTFDHIALQFLFNRNHSETKQIGAINIPNWRRSLAFCEFKMSNWKATDSVSTRLFLAGVD